MIRSIPPREKTKGEFVMQEEKSFQEMLEWIERQFNQAAINRPPSHRNSIFLPNQPTQVAMLEALRDYATQLRNNTVELNPQDQSILDETLRLCFEEIKRYDYVLP